MGVADSCLWKSRSSSKWIWAILFGFLVVAWGINMSANCLSTLPPIAYKYDTGKQDLPLPPSQNASSRQQQQHFSPVHVAFGLSGNHSGFLLEFEVALKSVLMQAPLDRELHMHILADQDAYRSIVGGIFNRTELSTWVTRNPMEIHVYDLSLRISSLELRILDLFTNTINPKFQLSRATQVHTIGAFFRLIAHQVISPSVAVKHLLYMDTDVVIMANLEELWRQVEASPNSLFHWGMGMISGFVVMNVPRMEEIWSLAEGSPMKSIANEYKQDTNDQLLYMSVNITHPNEVNILTEGWDMTASNLWQPRHRPYDKKYPNVGMLHYNGGGKTKEAYVLKDDNFVNTQASWRNGKYSYTMPWTWARYQAKSMIRPGSRGYLIKIQFWGTTNNERPHSSEIQNQSLSGFKT